MIYYKATRPDGTDFHSGTILYEPGKTVRPPKVDKPMVCGPGYLHAADVPAETLVGGSWPCRLFEVTGKPRAGFDADHPHKGGFKQLKVIREIEAWRALGPNGREVAALIERAGRLTPDEAERLRAAWHAAWNAAWDAARDAARWAARWAAGGAAWNAARDAAWNAAWDATWDTARNAARHAARHAVWDAAGALVVADLITPEHFDALYGPWRKVIG